VSTSSITKDTNMRDILERHPAAIEVFVKHFGQGCLTCPGAMMESVGFAAMMHGIAPEPLLQELNAVVEKSEPAAAE